MGDICTRNCGFCSVNHGRPEPIDEAEPRNIVDMVRLMQLRYLVITSVTRDDLDDGGSSHYARIIKELKLNFPDLKIEILIPDFKGNKNHILILCLGYFVGNGPITFFAKFFGYLFCIVS